jgi:hypothetical protein
MRRWIGVLAATLALASLGQVSAQQGRLFTDALRYNVNTQTIADNGSGTAATGTVTVLYSYVELTCNDANGCTVSISETGAREGAELSVTFVSANACTVSDSAGVVELQGGTAFVSAQWDTLTLRYVGDRWVEVARSLQVNASSTTTFTNKTLDAEGTGNVLTLPFALWLPAARCDNATASSPDWSFPTSNPGAPACDTGSNVQRGVLDFADGANTLSAQAHLRLPNDWTGTVGARFVWYSATTSGNVVWQLATICVADAETGDPAFNTASTVTDATKGSANQFNDASITSVTVTGCAAGETLFLRLFRDPTNGSDTLAGTARLVGLELTYRRAL